MLNQLDNYFALEARVTNLAETLIDPQTEWLLRDIDVYDFLVQAGFEPNRDTLYPAEDAAGIGFCFKGEIGEYAIEHAIKFLKEHNINYQHMLEAFEGTLVFMVQGLVASIMFAMKRDELDTISDEEITKIIITTIAHERRHATQSISMMDPEILNYQNLNEYLVLSHERDAILFSINVAEGDTAMNTVAEWQPTERQLQMYNKFIAANAF